MTIVLTSKICQSDGPALQPLGMHSAECTPSQPSTFTVVMFYEVTTGTDLPRTAQLLLRRIQSRREALVTLPPPVSTESVSGVSCLTTPLSMYYVADSLTPNSWPTLCCPLCLSEVSQRLFPPPGPSQHFSTASGGHLKSPNRQGKSAKATALSTEHAGHLFTGRER